MCLKFLFLINLILYVKSEINDEICDSQLKSFSDGLTTRESWAIELFDSWTKLRSGILSGNQNDLGHYDQCVEFRHDSNSTDIGEIKGQYCMIYFRASVNSSINSESGKFDWTNIGTEIRKRNLTLSGGYCLPASCSGDKVQKFIGDYLTTFDLTITNDFDQSRFCQTNDPIPIRLLDIFAIIITAIFLLLLIGSTSYEVATLYFNRPQKKLFTAFSVYKNGKRLFDLSREKSPNFVACLPGIRAISMIHILFGHRYVMIVGLPAFTPPFNADLSTVLLVVGFGNMATLAVDTFFVIGGFLLARSIFVAFEKKIFSAPKLYLFRYLRIMPLLAYLILVYLTIFRRWVRGPYYYVTSNIPQIEQCEKYWWTTLLHIATYYNPSNLCYGSSWYLNVDFQLVLVTPLIAYPAYKWGWKFLWLLPAYIIAIQIWLYTQARAIGYKASRFQMPTEVARDYSKRFYVPAHIRIGPWLIGIILGYVFYKLKNRKVVINKHLNRFFWILSISTIFAMIFGMIPLIVNENSPGHAIFVAMQNNSWAVVIAWIIFSCHMGGGGIIRKILELPVWRPLGRMSLSFYIVSSMEILIHLGPTRTPFWFDKFQMFHIAAGDILICLCLSTILFLTFEEPILPIIREIFTSLAERKKSKSETKELQDP